MGRVCHGPSLYGPSLLWAEFVMGRVCYGPSCPVTVSSNVKTKTTQTQNDNVVRHRCLKPCCKSYRRSCALRCFTTCEEIICSRTLQSMQVKDIGL